MSVGDGVDGAGVGVGVGVGLGVGVVVVVGQDTGLSPKGPPPVLNQLPLLPYVTTSCWTGLEFCVQ